MSTKTLRKRIALVAVSAMGFGLLSSVAANAAVPASATLYVASTASTTGSGVTNSGLQGSTYSVGWINKSSTAGTAADNGYTLASGAAGTATVYAGAKISFSVTSSSATNGVSVVVSGGTLSGIASTGTTPTVSLNGSATTAVSDGVDARSLYGVFGVSAAAGSTATITAYSGASITDGTNATNGALIGTWSFTVASASASGTYSAGDSTITTQAAIAKGGTSSTTVAYDNNSRIDSGKVGVIYVKTVDAYAGAVTGSLAVSATNGATVVATNSNVAAADSYSGTTSFATLSFDGEGYVVVNQPVANTAGSTTVTISLDGNVIATKTLNWNGVAASIALDTADSSSIFSNGYAAYVSGDTKNVNVFYVIKDAAGNVLNLSDQPTISDQTGSLLGASLSAATDTTGTVAAQNIDSQYQTATNGYGVATMLIPSSTLNGAGTYMLKYVNSAGTTIKSAAINATVSGAANTFSATWDKPSYAPGDIATLKITVKDSNGNLVADGVALGANSLVTTNTDGLASVTSACDSANIATTTLSGGSKLCKFAVKNTAGSYAYTAVVPTASGQAAAAGTVKIADSSTTVTNAEVLAAIVKLIASINKQIAALQKSLKK